MNKILKVKARQVFDSRGNPTIEAEVYTKNNSATSICPSGASTGTVSYTHLTLPTILLV